MPRKKIIGKYDKLHRILCITEPSISRDEVINLSIKYIPDVDWSVKKIMERLEQEGVKVRRGGSLNGSCYR